MAMMSKPVVELETQHGLAWNADKVAATLKQVGRPEAALEYRGLCFLPRNWAEFITISSGYVELGEEPLLDVLPVEPCNCGWCQFNLKWHGRRYLSLCTKRAVEGQTA